MDEDKRKRAIERLERIEKEYPGCEKIKDSKRSLTTIRLDLDDSFQ